MREYCRAHFHGKTLPWGQERRKGQWLEFLERDKEALKECMVLMETSRSHIMVGSNPKCCCAYADKMCKPRLERRRCRRHHQLRVFCAILARGGCGLVFPREMSSLFVSASPGESFPSGGIGLNSALGYILASPAVDGEPRARAWGFLALSESLMAKSIWADRMKGKDAFRRWEAFWQNQQLWWDVREVRVRP